MSDNLSDDAFLDAALDRRGESGVERLLLTQHGTDDEASLIDATPHEPAISRRYAEHWLRRKEISAGLALNRKYKADVRRARLSIGAGVLATIVGTFAWLSPRTPSKPHLKPDFLYRSGVALTHLNGSEVGSMAGGTLLFFVDPTFSIRVGQVLSFNDSTCIVNLVLPPGARSLFKEYIGSIKTEIDCQLVSG